MLLGLYSTVQYNNEDVKTNKSYSIIIKDVAYVRYREGGGGKQMYKHTERRQAKRRIDPFLKCWSCFP